MTTAISVASTPSLLSSSSSSLSGSPVPVGIADGDEENESSRKSRVGMRIGSCVDFRSILADAGSNGIGCRVDRFGFGCQLVWISIGCGAGQVCDQQILQIQHTLPYAWIQS
jgi:hypothetical protein